MAYSEKVIDHYENPRNVGSFGKEDSSLSSRDCTTASSRSTRVAIGACRSVVDRQASQIKAVCLQQRWQHHRR